MSNVINLRDVRNRRLNLSSMAQARFAAERQASGLSSKAFADLLSEILGWPVTPEAVSAWESASVPPGDVLLAADLAAGHQLAGIETGNLGLPVPTPPVTPRPARGKRTVRVFLSTPMASLSSDEYTAERAAAQVVYLELERIAPPVYWAAAQIGSAAEFEAPDLAVERNLAALSHAEAFVYLQLRELNHPSSCHVEIGMAVAQAIPVTIFAPSEDDLPYTLRHFEAISGRTGVGGGRFRFYATPTAADAVRLLAIHGPDLLGVPARPARRMEQSQ